MSRMPCRITDEAVYTEHDLGFDGGYFTVIMLCDGGQEAELQVWAIDEIEAERIAFNDAGERGYRPTQVIKVIQD